MLRRSIVLKIRRERRSELRCVLKVLGRQCLKLIGLHKTLKQLVGKRAHLLHLLGCEFQAVEDAREIGSRRLDHDVAEVDVLANARKVDIQARQIDARKIHAAGRTRERRRIERERALESRLVHAEHAAQVHALLGLALQLVKRFVGKDIRLGMSKLLLDNLRIGRALHKLASQCMRVGNTRRQRARVGSLVGLHHAHNAHVNAIGNLGCHKVGVARHVSPHAGLFVFAIRIGRRQHLKRRGQRIVVGKVGAGLGRFDPTVSRHSAVYQIVELIDIQRTDAVERVVAHRTAARKHHHGFVGRRGPMTGDDIVLAVEQALVVDHLVKDRGSHGIHARHRRRARATAHGLGHSVGNKPDGLLVSLARAIHDRRHAVAVLNGVDLFVDAVAPVVEPRLKARHVVGLNARKHILYGCDHGNLIGLLDRIALTVGSAARVLTILRSPLSAHHGRQVVILFGDGKRITRERILLDLFDVVVHTVGERQNRRDADNADRARKRRHGRTALFGHEVARRKPQRRYKAHRSFARGLGFATRGLGSIKGVGIIGDLTVRQVDDARGVLVRQLGIVRDHDDQAVARNLLEQVHDLHGRRRV